MGNNIFSDQQIPSYITTEEIIANIQFWRRHPQEIADLLRAIAECAKTESFKQNLTIDDQLTYIHATCIRHYEFLNEALKKDEPK